ncbi:hypothetical protein L3Q82_020055 [Scortum barcoo]|uniref:Uncharacterized protein n=1 Tax=Scortum barcoo TaxID=214431 RepID=A0ACB8VDJ8_9TELE|nr:hypothetical protein L3Q82_020055 [Scortum barcoo]
MKTSQRNGRLPHIKHKRGYHLIVSNQTVKAEEGGDVILKCHMNESINLQNYKFDVKRPDLKGQSGSGSKDTVYVHGLKEVNQVEQLDQYRNRTFVISEDLSRGILTLIISSVQLRDSGKYKMFVPKLQTSCFINLTVVPKAQQNGTKREDFCTTAPPTHDDEPGAENVKHDRHIISTIVGVSIFVVIIIVVVLVRRGTILKYASVVLDVHISVGKTLLAESVESFRAGLTCSYSSRTSPTIEAFLPGMCCLIQHLHKETKRDILHNRNRLQVSNNHLNQALCDVSGSLGVI